jgi:hypothetical protein
MKDGVGGTLKMHVEKEKYAHNFDMKTSRGKSIWETWMQISD